MPFLSKCRTLITDLQVTPIYFNGEGAHNPGPTWPPAQLPSATGISVTRRGVRWHGNTFVADDSCGGAKNCWKGTCEGKWWGEGGERKSTCSEVRNEINP